MTTPVKPVADETDFEQWENTTAGRISLKFYNQQGMLQDKLIDSYRKFQITPKERRLNQEMAAGRDLDHFANGILSPVRLIESAEDTAAIRSNPNLVTEDEMKDLMKSRSAKAFTERIEAITNPYALKRMLELANADDNATARQVNAIKDRLKTVSPSSFQEIETVGGPGPARGFEGAVTTADLGTR